ncbi:MAG: glutamate--tRNA ligase [Fimbriimonas sp.]
MSVRVRFAPSPTGLLHVGALRTVLFDHLFARHHGGQNLLRIEDTDRTRYNPESEQEFVDTLKWVGIEFDEGPHLGGPHAPYRQSERKEAGIYAPFVEELLASGKAYKAFDTSKELEEMREFQQINKVAIGYYGGSWRDATPEKIAEAEAAGIPSVVRLKIPRGAKIVLQDAIRGRLEWDSDTIDDPVLIKADGMPTYHFAAMVDDHLMGITHVFRGEEWISSAPKHAVLFDAFGWEKPIFIHCPVIVGADGKKLSKRHGATRVLDYAAQGFLPSALKNFIALIGWSPKGDREVMSEAEMIEYFEVSGLQPSPGKFDFEKLKWLNGHAIRALSTDDLIAQIETFVTFPHTRAFHAQGDPEGESLETREARLADLDRLVEFIRTQPVYAREAVRLEQERVTTLAEFGEACAFFFVEEPPLDAKAEAKWLTQAHVPALLAKIAAVAPDQPADYVAGAAFWDEHLRALQAELGFDKLGPIVHPTRVALTGKTVGPGLFELMALLGPERIAARIGRILSR